MSVLYFLFVSGSVCLSLSQKRLLEDFLEFGTLIRSSSRNGSKSRRCNGAVMGIWVVRGTVLCASVDKRQRMENFVAESRYFVWEKLVDDKNGDQHHGG